MGYCKNGETLLAARESSQESEEAHSAESEFYKKESEVAAITHRIWQMQGKYVIWGPIQVRSSRYPSMKTVFVQGPDYSEIYWISYEMVKRAELST